MSDNNGIDRKWKEVTIENSGEVWDKSSPLEGLFVEAKTDVGPNNSKMYTIETEEGEIQVWGSTVLDDKLMNVPKGAFVKIEYEGKLKSKRGTEYHGYKVFIDLDTMPQETPGESTGYSKAKDMANKLKGVLTDEEVAKAMDEPIDLDEIPF